MEATKFLVNLIFLARYLSKSNHSDISVYNTTYAGRTVHCFYSQMFKLSIAWQTEKKHFQDNGEQNKRIPNTPQRHVRLYCGVLGIQVL